MNSSSPIPAPTPAQTTTTQPRMGFADGFGWILNNDGTVTWYALSPVIMQADNSRSDSEDGDDGKDSEDCDVYEV